MTEEMNVQPKVYRILLLTNRDSDNVGDQVIEACDISLISTIMMNLGLSPEDFVINSRAAAIVSKQYVKTKDPELLATARSVIQECDLIIFGGAPVFNYLYQIFYERTAVTLELAKEYNKPVIFSAIGIEGYHEDNKKCQRLKETLNFDCVRQITTRDDFLSLEKYKGQDHITIGRVSDPAVFTPKVFKNFFPPISEKAPAKGEAGRKKIGLFVLRANGFKDNGVKFSREEAAAMWKEIVQELEARGYDYELLTSGHFGDEAFLDYLIRNYGIKEEKCVFNINFPERLLQHISSYDGIISCRLHPSIIAFSFKIPSLGLIWNLKVKYFYEAIGHEDRLVNVKETTASEIVSRLEKVMDEGVNQNTDYMITVYNSLFSGIKNILFPESSATPYSFDELNEKMVPFKGTSDTEKETKLKRKFRRTYEKYNDIWNKNMNYKNELKKYSQKDVTLLLKVYSKSKHLLKKLLR